MFQRNKTWIKPYLYLLPVMSILLLIFSVGLVMSIVQSLGYYPGAGLNEITLDYYREVLRSGDFISGLLFSLRVSMISSLFAAVIGLSLAYLLTMQKNRGRILESLLKLPIIVPHLIAAFLIFTLFSQSGIIARFGVLLGLMEVPQQFPELIFDQFGIGVILAYVWKGTPFVFLIVYQVLRSIDQEMIEAARNLGAGRREVFLRIFLPLSLPSVFSAFIILFAFSFGSYEIPFLLGATSPRALPVLAYIEYINPDWTNRPYAMAVNIVLAGVSVFLVWLYHWVFNRYQYYRKG